MFRASFRLAIAIRSFTSLIDQLNYYETIHVSDFSHKVIKRGIHPSRNKYNSINEVSFNALGRNFRLMLSPQQGLLSSRFKAFSVDGYGKKRPLWVNKDSFYDGRLYGELYSEASVHMEESGLLTATIKTADDIYVIEPSWRHLQENNNDSMIVYKDSDVKYSWDKNEMKQKFCGYVKVDPDSNNETESEDYQNNSDLLKGSTRIKRQHAEAYSYQPVKTRCSLLLIADYRFYRTMGGSVLKSAINYLISLIDRVHKIFAETEWKDNKGSSTGFQGMGFVIQEIQVHTEPTPAEDGKLHYNMEGYQWDVRTLLEVFSRERDHRGYCLAHLFTDQKFKGGILGLAYVGSPRRNSVGGICTPGYVKNGHTLYLNSGLSTSKNHYGQRVITREADLVTAHGHNWGSEHDPDLDECSPDSSQGGSYLMYTYSVSGYDKNNKKFSPCSLRSIRAVLLAKASKCFSEPEESFCGNLLIEDDEECDAGLIGSEDTDRCCTSECKLRSGAKCSDKNHPCCGKCQLLPAKTPCRPREPNTCKEESVCDGNSAACPESPPMEDENPCLERGKCKGGECIAFCETLGLQSCMCDIEKNACKRCCRPALNSSCDPFIPEEILKDGTPCIHGFCQKGKCEKTVQDIVERFWDIIEHININSVMKFLNDNIVGTVIVISIIVWLPASCVINYFDKKQCKRAKQEEEELKERLSKPFGFNNPKGPRIIRSHRLHSAGGGQIQDSYNNATFNQRNLSYGGSGYIYNRGISVESNKVNKSDQNLYRQKEGPERLNYRSKTAIPEDCNVRGQTGQRCTAV
ncbi:ADAM 17-like protease [Nymphon striatum]|nr:ADAM 17-like protease [Nymphon striatum]KAG1696666.1 ADAM 17-like protease [Nymphon striatum]